MPVHLHPDVAVIDYRNQDIHMKRRLGHTPASSAANFSTTATGEDSDRELS